MLSQTVHDIVPAPAADGDDDDDDDDDMLGSTEMNVSSAAVTRPALVGPDYSGVNSECLRDGDASLSVTACTPPASTSHPTVKHHKYS